MTGTRDRLRERALVALLDALIGESLPAWLEAAHPDSDPDWDGSLDVLALMFLRRWAEASALAADLAPVPSSDPDGWWLRRAASLWAASGDPTRTTDHDLRPRPGAPAPTGPLAPFAGHLMVEAVMAHARLDLVAPVSARFGPGLWEPLVLEGRVHPWQTVRAICPVRVHAFRGDISAAAAALRAIPEPVEGPLRALLAGTACLVTGNESSAAEVRRMVDEVDRWAVAPDDVLRAGAHMLSAFGLIALNDVPAAVRRVLVAGGDPDLSRLNVIDRALALETLVSLAVAEGDLDAAEAWAQRIAPLLASPIADSTAARTLGRVALLAGRPAEAVAWAERAVARASETDREIEYAEGQVLLGRARLELPGSSAAETVRELHEMVLRAEEKGARSARRAAARGLRTVGLRLPPVAGSGWAGLTAREAEVARLVAAGAGNREVAVQLGVTEHTVRAHVSRVLTAFAVATRSGLPAACAAIDPEAPVVRRPALTGRQAEVAALVATGLGNDEIADRLALSRRTVERHVSDVLLRWGLANRTSLAHEWSLQSTPAGVSP